MDLVVGYRVGVGGEGRGKALEWQREFSCGWVCMEIC